MAQKSYDVVVTTVKKFKHHIRIKARNGSEAITKVAKEIGLDIVYEVRVKEAKNASSR